MSGSSPNRPLPNQVPSRPNPVITSSAMNSTSWRRQISRTLARYPGGGGYTPPAPMTGSQKKAATRPAPSCSIVLSRAAGSSQATCSTWETSGRNGSGLAGVPPREGPQAVLPGWGGAPPGARLFARRAVPPPVGPRELGSRVHRVRSAARGEEDLGVRHRGQVGDPAGQFLGGRGGERLEDLGRGAPAGLGRRPLSEVG